MSQIPSMDQVFLSKLAEIIEANLHNENFGPAEVSRAMGMSRSGIHRKLTALTQQSLSKFIQEKRLHKSMEMLRQNVATASEIAFRVGFSSPEYFNKCFHEYYGYPPGEAKKMEAHKHEVSENTLTHEPTITRFEPATKLNIWNNRKRLYYWIIIFALFVILLLIPLLYFSKKPVFNHSIFAKSIRIENQDKSIAVLPFKDMSDDKENQYFTDGVMVDILNRLSTIRELRVISWTTSEHYRGSKLTAREFSKKINVNYILEGSVRRYGGKVRIDVQLIDARRDRNLWSDQYDMQLVDIFSVQTDIARKVANALQTVLSIQETGQIEKIPTSKLEAYNLSLFGRFFLNKRTKEGFEKSIEYFTKSIEVDPDFAQAYAGLANVYYWYTNYAFFPQIAGHDKAKEFALKALEIDKNQSEALAILAKLSFLEWKWEKARKEFMHAIECNPNDAMVRRYYVELLDMLGEQEEARRQIDFALELDPLSPLNRWTSSLLYFHKGENEAALEELRTVQKIDPSFRLIYWLFMRIYIIQGDGFRAMEAIQMAYKTDYQQQRYADGVKAVYSESGIKGIMKYVVENELRNPRPYWIAMNYAQMNEKGKALEWLEKVSEMDDIGSIFVEPEFGNIRSDSRFREIIKKMELSPYFSDLSKY